MVLNSVRRVSFWHATDNTHMPRLARGVPEVADAPAVPPDRSGVYGVVACPAPRDSVRLGRTCRASGLTSGGAFPRAGRGAGVHAPRADAGGGTARLRVRAVA